MKETTEKQTEFDPKPYTNPILEECYRIKAEISAQFKTVEEYVNYLKKKEKLNEIKHVSVDEQSKYNRPKKTEDEVSTTEGLSENSST